MVVESDMSVRWRQETELIVECGDMSGGESGGRE